MIKLLRYLIPAVFIYLFYFAFIGLSASEESILSSNVYTDLFGKDNIKHDTTQLDKFMKAIEEVLPADAFQRISAARDILEAYKMGETQTKHLADRAWENL